MMSRDTLGKIMDTLLIFVFVAAMCLASSLITRLVMLSELESEIQRRMNSIMERNEGIPPPCQPGNPCIFYPQKMPKYGGYREYEEIPL